MGDATKITDNTSLTQGVSLAIQEKDSTLVNSLLGGSDLNIVLDPTFHSVGNNTLLTSAIEMEDVDTVNILLKALEKTDSLTKNTFLETEGRYDESPLVKAISLGNLEIVKDLINAGALVDTRDEMGNSLLHKAVEAKNININIIKALIDAGAPLDGQNDEGESALDIAKQKSRQDIIDLINKANISYDDDIKEVLKKALLLDQTTGERNLDILDSDFSLSSIDDFEAKGVDIQDLLNLLNEAKDVIESKDSFTAQEQKTLEFIEGQI